MTVQEIMDALDLHGFEDIEDDDKVDVINDVIWEICSRDPWPFLEVMEDIDAADVDEAGKVTLTDGFTAILDVINTDTSADRGKLQWIRRDEHFSRNSSSLTESGTPYKYFFVGDSLYVWPVPDTANLRVTYLKAHEAVTSASGEADILIPARHHRAILMGAVYKLHSQEDDPENSAMFKSLYDERVIMMRKELFIKQYDRPDSILVVDDDDYGY